jgi:hypothetical protein
MSNRTIIVTIALLALTTGCVAIHPQVEERYGDSVRAATRAQTLNPEGTPNRDVVGIDGRAAKETMDRYVDSFRSPPPTMNVINIGGSLSGQDGGNR